MEVLRSTQFAHVAPSTKGLPPFLAKKLEQAIVEATVKNQKNKDEALKEKLAKAQKIREEKRSQRVIKAMVYNDKINVASDNKIAERINCIQIQQEIIETKLKLADLKAKEHIQKQLLKAQQMGTYRVNLAKETRNELNAVKNSKVYKEDKGIELKETLNKAISEKRQNRNYTILKIANRKRFESVKNCLSKKEKYEEKQMKAKARREQLINKKVQKAKEMASADQFIEQEVVKMVKTVSLATQISKSDPQEDFTERECELIQQAKKAQELKANEALIRRLEIMKQKMNKVRSLATKNAPTAQQKRYASEQNRKVEENKLNFSKTFETSVCFTVQEEEEKLTNDGSETHSTRAVFVQSDVEDLKRKPHMRDVKQSKNGKAIAFTIDRAFTRAKSTQKTRKSDDENQWELV